MFKNLSKYRKILVTGPRRSGTLIASKIIAPDTGHEYIDENDFDVSNADLFNKFVCSEKSSVIHCPGMRYKVDFYSSS